MTRPFLSLPFVVSAVVLVAAAVGLKPAIGALQRHYSKEPIDLRLKLDAFDPAALPSWQPATDRIRLKLGEGDVETPDVMSMVFEPRGPEPGTGEQTMLFVTYYSDPRDRISHTPEVCYRQGGAVIQSIKTVVVDTPGLGPEHPRIEARLLDIDSFGRRSLLVYVFVCNGEFYYDREAVRFAIGWPGDRYTYFSKIESITLCPTENDYDDAVARCKSLLAEALPVLCDRHYPANAALRR